MEWASKRNYIYYLDYPGEFESTISPLIMASYHPYIQKSNFESKMYEETLAEIERLENELNETRQFLCLIEPGPAQAKKSPLVSAQKPTRRKSARKATKPKLTKSGKKVGRPTNAEKWVKENKKIVEKDIEKGIKSLKSKSST